MKPSDLRLIARTAITERAKCLIGEQCAEFIVGEEITRHSYSSAVVGISNQVADVIMIARDRAIKLNPHVPMDIINNAVQIGLSAIHEAIGSAIQAANETPSYVANRAIAVSNNDISEEGLIGLLHDLNNKAHGQ
jgi:hypothetical protein